MASGKSRRGRKQVSCQTYYYRQLDIPCFFGRFYNLVPSRLSYHVGPYAGKTDAKYLSIGLAQWRNDENDPNALSAKVWRCPDEKWSRMSEEIPLHRLADLCTLLVKTFYQDHPTNAVTPTAVIDAGTFENQSEKIELRRMNGVPEGFAKENERIKERLRKLRNELNAANLD
jgi:hypothetical protein